MRAPCRKLGILGLIAATVAQPAAARQNGPDVIVKDLPSVRHWGTLNNIQAYSVGTTSCNIGDRDLQWVYSTNRHPVIGQNLFRLKNGRLEHIGLSWLKHGFVTVNNGLCGTCPPNGTGDHLSPGCSDPYNADLNGRREKNGNGGGGLGPRYQVNASTGFFNFPYDDTGPRSQLIDRRIQVHDDLVNPALNAGALYFVEGQYVAPDDAEWGNSGNNNTYRRVAVDGNRIMTTQGGNYEQIPAIFAWRDHGNGPGNPDPSVRLTAVDVANDGRFWVAAKVTDLGNGRWHYEYAIQNLTSHRSAGSFGVATAPGAQVSNQGFHDVNYHSGEPYNNDDWTWKSEALSIRAEGQQTHAQNPNANALRWGTTYNFWFDIDAAPVDGNATIGLFRPGTPDSVAVATLVPTSASVKGDVNCDGALDAFDIEPFTLAIFDPAGYQSQYPNCDIMRADINGDNLVDAFDIEPFIDLLFAP